MTKGLRRTWYVILSLGLFNFFLFLFGVVLVHPAAAGEYTDLVEEAAVSGGLTNWGRTGANTKQYAIKWIPEEDALACSIQVGIGKGGGGALGDVKYWFMEGGATPPEGVELDSVVQPNASIGNEIDFTECIPVTAGETYWIELQRTSNWAESPNHFTANGGAANPATSLYLCASGSDRCSAGEWALSGSPEIQYSIYGLELTQENQFSTGEASLHIPWGGLGITKLAQEWTPDDDVLVCRVDSVFEKSGIITPIDSVGGEIWEGGSSPQSGVRYATILTTGATLPTTPTTTKTSLDYRTVFDGCITFHENVKYYFVIRRQQLQGTSSYYQGANTTTYSNARAWTADLSGIWSVTTTINLSVDFYGSTSTVGFGTPLSPAPLFSSASSSGAFPAPTCPDYGLFTPLCELATWIFVPNLSAVGTEISAIKAELDTKFPFSYVAGIRQSFATELTYASSGTSPVLTLDFGGVSATSSFGRFLPTSTIAFSSSTVFQYGSSSTWSILKFLLSTGVYVGTIEMIYFGSMRLFKKDET